MPRRRQTVIKRACFCTDLINPFSSSLRRVYNPNQSHSAQAITQVLSCMYSCEDSSVDRRDLISPYIFQSQSAPLSPGFRSSTALTTVTPPISLAASSSVSFVAAHYRCYSYLEASNLETQGEQFTWLNVRSSLATPSFMYFLTRPFRMVVTALHCVNLHNVSFKLPPCFSFPCRGHQPCPGVL
ncbi:hypothetical protein DEU56DRAFT_199120 [Suillus clintonianus]|uniref:uncharacterized protein n=1 Tax=Suillus clintonianus TaxID=1904413 RepID=UPI001B874D2A|nr:uncharacterized protein DEU56DRAFT_199120 [Suillus clintonianus]KAG2112879.1 hypothetical protein DEU56DRAFT_199120 [Suillus clintonianus]